MSAWGITMSTVAIWVNDLPLLERLVSKPVSLFGLISPDRLIRLHDAAVAVRFVGARRFWWWTWCWGLGSVLGSGWKLCWCWGWGRGLVLVLVLGVKGAGVESVLGRGWGRVGAGLGSGLTSVLG